MICNTPRTSPRFSSLHIFMDESTRPARYAVTLSASRQPKPGKIADETAGDVYFFGQKIGTSPEVEQLSNYLANDDLRPGLYALFGQDPIRFGPFLSHILNTNLKLDLPLSTEKRRFFPSNPEIPLLSLKEVYDHLFDEVLSRLKSGAATTNPSEISASRQYFIRWREGDPR